ncbi:hypothetical protein Barb4_02520 [Bacteroidales bacterium Barb4]|nr:hypothetical protein Barb4_02520 [Bacteroidales bacterium Barb4]
MKQLIDLIGFAVAGNGQGCTAFRHVSPYPSIRFGRQTVVVKGRIAIAGTEFESCLVESMAVGEAAEIIIQLGFHLFIFGADRHLFMRDIFHRPVGRTMGKEKVKPVFIRVQKVIAEVAVEVQICAAGKVEIAAVAVIVRHSHNATGGKEIKLLGRIDREGNIGIIDRHFAHFRFFDSGEGVHLVGILHGGIVFAFKGHFPVQAVLCRVFLCMGNAGHAQGGSKYIRSGFHPSVVLFLH